jgi:hypothetical protein
MAIYQYEKFWVVQTLLEEEIENSAIGIPPDYILFEAPDKLSITFDPDLNPADKSVLDVIVAQHPSSTTFNNIHIDTVPPTVNNDATEGFTIGSRWINTTDNDEYVCISNAIGNTVWELTTSGDDSVSNVIEMPCTVNELIWQFVYVDSTGNVVASNSEDSTTTNVLGIIIDKPTYDTCLVQTDGIVEFNYDALLKGKYYYLDLNDGEFTEFDPSLSNRVQLGLAISSRKLALRIAEPFRRQ